MEERAQNRIVSKIQGLEASLSEAQQKLNRIATQQGKDHRFILSPQQQQELTNGSVKKRPRVKKKLKQVRKNSPARDA